MKLVTVAEMQAIESEANERGWTYAQMMERAGLGLAEIVHSFYGYDEEPTIIGLVGSGNNGSDTLIALEELAGNGWRTRAYMVRPRLEMDPLVRLLLDAGGEVAASEEDQDMAILDAWVAQSSVLLDGVLGTGFRLPLKEEVRRVLARVKNNPACPAVVAVDCPSGVDCDSGQAAEDVIPADVTVCMAAVKTGMLKFPAYALAGDIEVTEIGLPDDLPSWEAVQVEMMSADLVRDLLPDRPLESHKGTYGTVGVVAGSLNYSGAVLLSGQAAHRAGAGLVQIAVPAPLHAALAGQFLEATWVLLPDEMGFIAAEALDVLARRLERVSVLLWGPGFGTEESTAGFVRGLIAGDSQAVRQLPMVIDADGLKLLAQVDGWAQRLPEGSVLTPHPGEMALLTGLSVAEIQADRMLTAQRFAAEWGHVVVLKGAITVVAEPGGRVRVIPIATSALAHAGTGDVLSGIIAGLRAQGMAAFDAAACGAWLHGQAGLLAVDLIGHEAAVLAGDLIEALPLVFRDVWN
jgi:NAD(P)H-hydrate epimerase